MPRLPDSADDAVRMITAIEREAGREGNFSGKEGYMNKSDITKKPERDIKNATHTIVKAGLGSIPIVGAAAAEIFYIVIEPPLSKRRVEWIESIAKRLKELEEKVEGFKIEELSRNEMFITTVMHASQVAIRNHQEEKLEALCNAISNSALPDPPEESIQLMFLNWIDEITPWHLRILKFFDSPERWIKEFNIKIPDWPVKSPLDVFFHIFPEMKKQEPFFNLLFQDLADLKELLTEDKLRSAMKKMAYLRISHTTNFGKQFIRFITSPIK